MAGNPKGEAGNAGKLTRVASAGSNEEASILRSYLEHQGIYVYVQGENHRSMLGMVGAYIDLYIMVPEHSVAEATELLEEYYAADEESDEIEIRGPYRDDDWDAAEDDEEYDEAEIHRAVRGARLMALLLPMGGGHFTAGAKFTGLFLFLVSMAGILQAAKGNTMLLLLWPMAVVMDLALVAGVIRNRKKR
jgi:hypothetical protein